MSNFQLPLMEEGPFVRLVGMPYLKPSSSEILGSCGGSSSRAVHNRAVQTQIASEWPHRGPCAAGTFEIPPISSQVSYGAIRLNLCFDDLPVAGRKGRVVD
jgi:hypothetical protein